MNLNSNLTNDNLLLYAAKFYDNPNCESIDEFYYDLSIPLHIKKLFTRYTTNKDLKERLILNHFISLLNVFPVIAATKIIFLKTDPSHYPLVKTVLVYLDRCPNSILVNSNNINIDILKVDSRLLDRLNKC